ncbi:hypothetical protein LXL04_018570 [Taraxacum kok-saghyz]
MSVLSTCPPIWFNISGPNISRLIFILFATKLPPDRSEFFTFIIIPICRHLHQEPTLTFVSRFSVQSERSYYYSPSHYGVAVRHLRWVENGFGFFRDGAFGLGFLREQLIGVRILKNFTKNQRFSEYTLQKIGITITVIERLVEMLNWKDPHEEEIRKSATEILAELAGKNQNSLRVVGIAGANQRTVDLW